MLDTIKFANSLTEAGLSEPVAKVVASSIADAVQGSAVTKSDLDSGLLSQKVELKEDIHYLDKKMDSVKTELKDDIHNLDKKIDSVKTELKDDIHNLDKKIDTSIYKIVSLLGGLITVVGFVLGLLQFFHH